ncbi:MAG: ROK family protein [Candidatus Nitrospinota bacterium M3_3B_026]
MGEGIYVIGVDLGGTNVRAAAVSPEGAILSRAKLGSRASEGYGKVLDRVAETARKVMDEMGMKPAAVGVGSAGAIDFDRGVVTRSPNFPDWRDTPLLRDLEDRLGAPVRLENDANAAAIGEGWKGAAVDWDDFLAFTLGTGVGGGLVLGNKIWHGTEGMAGEVGHIPIRPGGRLCGCGARGCLEAYASASGVAHSARERFNEPGAARLREMTEGRAEMVDAALVAKGAMEGDELMLGLLAEAGEYLGRAMAAVALILDVSRFVIGGGMSEALPLMESAMRRAALASAYTLDDEKLMIRKAALGDDAGILGAAKVAMESCSG